MSEWERGEASNPLGGVSREVITVTHLKLATFPRPPLRFGESLAAGAGWMELRDKKRESIRVG